MEGKALNWNIILYLYYTIRTMIIEIALGRALFFFARSLGLKRSVLAVAFHRIQGRGNLGSLGARFNYHIIALTVGAGLRYCSC